MKQCLKLPILPQCRLFKLLLLLSSGKDLGEVFKKDLTNDIGFYLVFTLKTVPLKTKLWFSCQRFNCNFMQVNQD